MKKCSRFLSLLLAAVMVLELVPAQIPAAKAVTPMAVTEDGFHYEVHDDHVEITDYTGNARDLVIPDRIAGLPVTIIDSWAFYDRSILRSVTIPECVTHIMDHAFTDCRGMTSVIIPESVTHIGECAFQDCRSLTSVTIPERVTSISDHAFSWCLSLTNVTIPDGVTSIGNYAFYASELTSVSIPESVVSIGEKAFDGCSLTSVTIPKSVTSIGIAAFSDCMSLTGIHVDTDNPNYSSDSCGVLFNKEKTELLQAPGAITGSYSIPDSVDKIWERAFYWCYHLTGVTIPGSVISIGSYAFVSCDDLASVTISDGVANIGMYAFESCTGIASVTIPKSVTSIGVGAFSGCRSLTGIHVDRNNPVFSSDSYGVLFNKDKTEVIMAPCGIRGFYALPDGVAVMGEGVFENCFGLTGVTIPDSVTGIGERAFEDCTGLTSVSILGSVTSIGEGAFRFCESLTSIEIPAGVTSIDAFAFEYCSGLTSITIPGSVTSIGYGAFQFCKGLTSVTIPESINTIHAHVFAYCEGLTSVMIPTSVTEIKDGAFLQCRSLKDVTIPGSVSRIGQDAFSACFDLETITFCGDAPEIRMDVFEYITVTAYYPAGNPTWTSSVMLNYGGNVTWVAYEHVHEYIAVVTAPTCTEDGFTTYTCICADSYTVDYVDALGHDYINGRCTHCGDPDPDCPDSPFDDVPRGVFYYFPVLWAVENGITTGSSATTFNPGGPCQRAQVVTFLWRAAGCPEPAGTEHPFVDVKETDFYYKAVLWAVERGITNGVDATRFGPFTYCNRAQVVTFLYRTVGDPEVGIIQSPFTDVQTGAWYETPVFWAVENGITNGMGNGIFGVNTVCNRAQVVTFLYRTYAAWQPDAEVREQVSYSQKHEEGIL